MSRVLRRGMMVVLCLLAAATGTAEEGKAPPGKQEQLEEAKRLGEQGERLYNAGKYADAVPLVERQLQLRETVLGKDHPDVASSLNDLAELHVKLGGYAKAEPLYLRGLRIREAALGKDHPDVAKSLNDLAWVYQVLGGYAKAEPLYLRALQIKETSLGKGHPAVATTLNNLAFLYQEQGAYAKAEPLHLRALQIREAALGKDHPDVASSVNNLALLYCIQGAYAKAEPLYLRALQIVEKALGKNHRYVGLDLNNLGDLYHKQGAYAKAESMYQRALQVYETALGKNHPLVATTLNNLAYLYQDQGAYAKAEPLFLRSRQILEETQGKNISNVAASLYSRAKLYQAQGASQQALPLFSRALSISEQVLRQVRLLATESRLDAFLKTQQDVLDTFYSLPGEVPQDPSARSLALTTALLRKGRSLDETALASRELSDLQRDLVRPEDQADLAQWQSLRRQLAKLYLQQQGQKAENIKDLEDRIEEMEQKFSVRSTALREGRQMPGADKVVARVSEALPADSVLVEVVLYRPYQFRATGKMPRWGDPRYLALTLYAGEKISAKDLGPAAPIDQAVLAFLKEIADQDSSLQTAQDLHNKVFAPLLPALAKSTQVFLSLDGQLQYLPFAALHDGTSFLLDRYTFTYLSSGRDLLRAASPSAKPPSLVVIANPDFAHARSAPSHVPLATAALVTQAAARGERAATMVQVMEGLGELPGTQVEADRLKRRFPQAKLLVRRAATKSALLGQHEPGILHLATHGLLFWDAPASAGPGGRGAWPIVEDAAPPASDTEVNPLRALSRSALMLAGAKVHNAQDGVATALEVAGMNLRGTQLVVLSACDTGRGEVKRGEGLYGFRRAFFLAGAETLVTSLWKVADQSTARLMDLYYANLQEGEGRVAAMHEAMKTMRDQYHHPYYWAPFIVMGRGDPVRGLGALRRPSRRQP